MNFRRRVFDVFTGVVIGALLLSMTVAPGDLLRGVHAQSTSPMGPYGWLPWVAANTAADTASIGASKLTGILIGTPTAAASYTTATATQLCALFPFVETQGVSNFGWDLYIKNTSAGAFAITLLGGSGVTVSGTATAAQNAVRHFKVVLTECRAGSTAAATIFSLETTAF